MAKNLDYIHQQLTDLNVVESVPNRYVLVNRALDVRSSSMLYLAAQLKHDGNRLGLPGMTLSLANF